VSSCRRASRIPPKDAAPCRAREGCHVGAPSCEKRSDWNGARARPVSQPRRSLRKARYLGSMQVRRDARSRPAIDTKSGRGRKERQKNGWPMWSQLASRGQLACWPNSNGSRDRPRLRTMYQARITLFMSQAKSTERSLLQPGWITLPSRQTETRPFRW
jgi:hypothetical protein